MKKYIPFILSTFLITTISGCSSHNEKDEHEAEHHHEHSEHEEDVIILAPHTATRLGVLTDTIQPVSFGQVTKVSGTISVAEEGNGTAVAHTSGIITLSKGLNVGAEIKAGTLIGTIKSEGISGGDANRAARIEIEAAQREFNRIAALYTDNLVTAAQYNEAKAALERARAAYSAPAASGKIVAPVSGIITSINVATGQYLATGEPVLTIGSSSKLNIRANIPSSAYPALSTAKDAVITIPSTGKTFSVSSLGGRRIDSANATAAATSGYVPMTFTVPGNRELIPGMAVELYISEGKEHPALAIPASALIEQQGSYFVYIRLDEDCYKKMPVKKGASNGILTEIVDGLKPGDVVVTEGATIVRLAEAGKNIPEGHSHSH